MTATPTSDTAPGRRADIADAAGNPGNSAEGGQFSPDNLAEALTAVCAAAGLDPAGAELLRCTNNAVFELASAPVVVRIVASNALRHRVGDCLRRGDLARLAARQEARALMPGRHGPVQRLSALLVSQLRDPHVPTSSRFARGRRCPP